MYINIIYKKTNLDYDCIHKEFTVRTSPPNHLFTGDDEEMKNLWF